MAAIRKNNTPPTPPPTASIIGTKANQPPRFRATGQGYFNKLPRFPADAKIANGSLTNHAVPTSHEFHKIYLFVDSVETAWSLAGETSQAQTSRSFYPRNMQQDDLVVQGVVANQYEFDRIACFVDAHHLSQFNPNSPALNSLDPNASYPATTFHLFRPQTDKSLDQHPPMKYGVVITNFKAGHQRFMNFPTFTLTCKVLHDHLQKDDSVEQDLQYWTTIKDVFGNVLPPVLSNGSTKRKGTSNVPRPTQPGTNP